MTGRGYFRSCVAWVHVGFAVGTVGVIAWVLPQHPGTYSGHLIAGFSLPEPNARIAPWVMMTADSPSKWRWSHADAIRYARVEVTAKSGLEGARFMAVSFPGPTYVHSGREEPLSKERFVEFVAGDKPSLREPAEWLFGFVLSAGSGDLPRPTRERTRVDNPVEGTYWHFTLGRSEAPWFVGGAILLWLATWRLIHAARRRRRAASADTK